MTARIRFRDALKAAVPWWLSDRPDGVAPYPGPTTLNVGYRVLWLCAALLDCGVEVMYQGIQAAWPGAGATQTADPLIAQSRDLLIGETETPEAFEARAQEWLEQHAVTGPAGLAAQLHFYLPGQPMVRIVDRSGNWVTVDASGNLTYLELPGSWNWDGTSNPERAGFWSELWVIIYGTVAGQSCYPVRPGTEGGLTGDDGDGWGLLIPHISADNVRRLIAGWKGAHSRIRCVIFTPNPAQFNPPDPTSDMPDGQWGQWGLPGSDPYVAGHRDTSCRYLEPNG